MDPEVFSNSCLVLQSVCSSVQTMLGPNKSLKCYISSDDDAGILGDTKQVLDALMAAHPPPSSGNGSHQTPILRLLYDCCLEQQERVGCGVTTLICLTGYWAPEILSLLHQGIPLPVIFAIFREALNKCIKLFKSLLMKPLPPIRSINGQKTSESERSSHPLRTGNSTAVKGLSQSHSLSAFSTRQRKVLTFSRHFKGTEDANNIETANLHTNEAALNSSRESDIILVKKQRYQLEKSISEKLAHGKATAMHLALEARRMQDQEPIPLLHTRQDLPPNTPFSYYIVGKPEEQSRVVRGVVTALHPDMLSVSHALLGKKLKILVLESDCTPGFKPLGFQQKTGHVISHDQYQLYEESKKSKWLNQAISVFNKHDIGILIVGGTICLSLWDHCISSNILVLKGVSAKSRTALADMCGTRPLTYLNQCSTERLGGEVSLEVLESGWDIPRVTYSTSNTARRKVPIRTYCCRLFQQPSSPHHTPHHYISTALLCGLSESSVDNLRHQFNNCLQRLHWATTNTPNHSTSHTTYQILPGGGKTEAACIKMLEEASNTSGSESGDVKLPFYFTHSWMSEEGVLESGNWRLTVYQGFANGLRKYVIRTVLNAKPELEVFEAMCELERMVETGPPVRVSCEDHKVWDVLAGKKEAWQRALQLLETVFFSKRVKNWS